MKYLDKGHCSYPVSQKLIVALMYSESRALLPSHAFLSLMISNSLVNKTESWLPGSRQSPRLCDGASACVHLLHRIKPQHRAPRASRSIFLSLAVQASSIPPVDLVSLKFPELVAVLEPAVARAEPGSSQWVSKKQSFPSTL